MDKNVSIDNNIAMSLFTKVKDPKDIEKFLRERRSIMNEAKTEVTLAAAGKSEADFKSAKQAEKQLAPLTSLTKEVIDQLKLQTDDLEAIRQLSIPAPPAAPPAKLPLPAPSAVAVQPSPQKQAKVVELFPNYDSDKPVEVLLKGLDNLKDYRTEVDIKRDGDDFTINGERGFLADDEVGLDKNNLAYPLTKGLAFLLATPFAEFNARQGRGVKAKNTKDLFGKMLRSVESEDAENYLQLLADTGYQPSNKQPEKYKFATRLVDSPADKEDIIDKLVNKPKKGKGLLPQVKGRPYRVERNGEDLVFGDLTIDKDVLYTKMLLQAYDSDGKLAVKAKIDASFIDLLTKRFNTKKIYSDKAKNAFKKLMLASRLEPNMKSAKYKWLYDDKRGGKIDVISKLAQGFSLDELADRLQILMGSINAGNNSKLIFNEAMHIIDVLLNKGAISSTDHKGLFNQLMNLVKTAASKL